jgi:hypothetical protein
MMRTPGFILASAFGVEDVAGLVGQRRVQRDEVGAASSSSSSTLVTPSSSARSFDRNGSIGEHMHLQARWRLRDDRADIAAADHAERLAGDLDAHELRLLPLAGLGRGVGFGQLAGDGEHHRDGVFGGGDRVAEGRVHHDDAAARGGRNVDIVDADAGAADHLEIGRPLRSASRSPWWPSGWRGRHTGR